MGDFVRDSCYREIPQACISLWQEAVGNECHAMVAALEEEPTISVRFHPQKGRRGNIGNGDCVPWCATGSTLAERPLFTLDPHFHAGAYYVQEASSMFLAQLTPLFEEHRVKRVLDLCAAPGGKSTLLAELLPEDGILVANEVIRSRVPVLAENMAKWGYVNVAVTHNDAKDFGKMLCYFDAILVDAPCSGEGMFRKEHRAREEWSVEAVRLCANRQRRIVADVWHALRTGGFLIYSTCTFNRIENEENVAWICAQLGATVVPLSVPTQWGVLEQEGCYRFLPHRIKGEGLFFAVLQKNGSVSTNNKNQNLQRNGYVSTSSKGEVLRNTPVSTTSRSRSVRSNSKKASVGLRMPAGWVKESYCLSERGDLVKALPSVVASEMVALETALKVVQSGVAVARAKGDDWIPEADLALSPVMLPSAFPVVEVDLATARRYLAREAIFLSDIPLGYLVIQYQGSRIGFAKNIGARLNNLYPQSRRIMRLI